MTEKLPEIITEEEFKKILEGTKNQKHKLAFALGFYECLRVSEVACLLPENVNRELKLLLIKGSDVSKGKKGAKRGKDRNIPIAPEILKGLKYLPVGSIKAKDRGVRGIQLAFKKSVKKILNRDDIHFHTLRHCLSEDVKILTKTGWKDYKELKRDEEIYTLNIPEDKIEPKKVINIYKYNFNGNLNHIKNKYIDCLFTDEHKFVIKRRKQKNKDKRQTLWGNWELLEWNKMPTQFKIKLGAKKKEGKSIGIHKAGILGWILSDGKISRQKKDNKCYNISLSQSLTANKIKCNYIENALIKGKIPYTKSIEKIKINAFSGRPSQMVSFFLLKGGDHSRNTDRKGKNYEWIFEFINEDRTPKWNIFDLKLEDLEEIHKTMMMGDGSRGREYCNQNINRIEFFKVLSLLIGKRVLGGKGIINMGKNKGKEKYRNYLVNRDDCQVDKKHISKKRYKGIVWCPETENGTIIAKRNNTLFITGNSGITHYLTKKKWNTMEVQRLAGHSKSSITEIYTHINPQNLVERMWE